MIASGGMVIIFLAWRSPSEDLPTQNTKYTNFDWKFKLPTLNIIVFLVKSQLSNLCV